MAERPSGYYWVRLGDLGYGPIVAQWMGNSWLQGGVRSAPCQFEVLFGPIPGPEELAAMAKDRERIDKVVMDLQTALKLFMDIWGSGDATSHSKRAQRRRADMWDKANAAIAQAAPEQETP